MATATTAPPARPESTPIAERALAPDLARGMMLLLIALAHVPWFLYTTEIGHTLMHPADGSVADRVAQAFTIVVVDGRTHTMFGFLLAYGIGQLYARQRSKGTSERDVRRVLRARHLWLLVFGFVHAALLWQGDILGPYGLMGLLLVPLFLGRSDRTLKIWIGILLGLGAVVAVGVTVISQLTPAGPSPMVAQQLANGEEDYLAAMIMRIGLWLPSPISNLLTFVQPVAFLIGILAARHRVLDEPSRHLPLLRRTAVAGIAVGWGFGVVQVLAHLDVLALPNPGALVNLHLFTGLFAGLGYAAAFGLIAHRLGKRGATDLPLPAQGLLALGRRSMSGYVSQSLLFIPLLSAWGLGVGAHLSSWSTLLVGIGTWLITVVAALAMDRAGIRGPLETLLRKLAYRPLRRSQQKQTA